MTIQTMGFEAKSMPDLVNSINKFFGTDPRANGTELIDIKYSCTGATEQVAGGIFSSNLYRYTALVILKVH